MTTIVKPRFSWAALLLGLLAGIGGGLAYAWLVNPVKYVDVAPGQLGEADRQAYVLLIAEAYIQDQDLERAQARLLGLDSRDAAAEVASQADSALLRGVPGEEVSALAILAEALGQPSQAAGIFSGSVAAPPAVAVTTATPPAPTSAPAPPTVAPPTGLTTSPGVTMEPEPPGGLELVALETSCLASGGGVIEVYVFDEVGGAGLPAIPVVVSQGGVSERFLTGFKRDISPGYADYVMTEGTSYTVVVEGLSGIVSGIEDTACVTDDGDTGRLNYVLVFAPPAPNPTLESTSAP